jgi:hypothetical protein
MLYFDLFDFIKILSHGLLTTTWLDSKKKIRSHIIIATKILRMSNAIQQELLMQEREESIKLGNLTN